MDSALQFASYVDTPGIRFT